MPALYTYARLPLLSSHHLRVARHYGRSPRRATDPHIRWAINPKLLLFRRHIKVLPR